MKFYYLSLHPLPDTPSVIEPLTPFPYAPYQNQFYTPICTTIQAACRHRYPDVHNTILEQGYATAYLYELHLSKADIQTLVTPEVMLVDGFRHFDKALIGAGQHYKEIEVCCLTKAKNVEYVGEVNIFESLAFEQPAGTLLHPHPEVIDYYVIVNKMSDDKIGFVTRKAFSQVSTEIRHITPGYEDMCRLFRQLGKGDDVVPLVLQKGHYDSSPRCTRQRFTPPCMTFILTPKGDALLRQYQVILNSVLVDYGFDPTQLFVIKSKGQFSRHVGDYYERPRYQRTCDYSTTLISFVYRDKSVCDSSEQLDRLQEAYELALLMLID